jgi:hypothetical protein
MRLFNILAIAMMACLIVGCASEGHYRDKQRTKDIAYLWTLVRRGSAPIKEDITVRGMVVANDKLNEISHSVIIADDSGGIEIAIDSEHIDKLLPLYSNVLVSVSGLYIGRQGDKCIIGRKPTDEYVVDRLRESDIPLYFSRLADEDVLRAKRMSICEIESKHLLHYIYVEDVRFVDQELGLKWCDRDYDGELINTIRHLTDGVDTLRIVCSKACDYATATLPTGNLTCFGVVDYAQGDIALRITDEQVVVAKR